MGTVRYKGIDKLAELILETGKSAEVATARAIKEVAVNAGRKADELVPYDTGNLQRSQTIDMPSPENLRAVITYGGTSAPYALIQHEDLTLFHPSKARGGKGPTIKGKERGPKYLEEAVKVETKQLEQMIAQNLRELT